MTATVTDHAPPTSEGKTPERRARVVVVGAGIAGIAAVIKLEKAGIKDVIVLEKADRVGGTWRENTYPGCGCDIPAPVYSFSFNPNPGWRSNFALQPEILSYVEDTVAKFGVGKRIKFGTELIEAAWSDERRRWVLETTGGRWIAEQVIFAAGPITEPAVPDVPGLAQFPGEVFHSGRWNHDVDLRGKRVAVIGTGASAVQFVPEIVDDTERVTVFQRTPSWVIPRTDLPFPGVVKELFKRVPVTQQALRGGLDVILRTMSTAMRRDRTARLLNPLGTSLLRRQVADPELRAALTPDFTLGCKRLLISNAWYPTLCRDDVDLVPHAMTAVEGSDVIAADGSRHPADVIIFGTGFDVSHPPIANRIRDRNGALLSERWAASPRAYLSTTVTDVPNAYVLLGPNILVYNSFLGLAEAQMDYVIDAITTMSRKGVEVAEISAEVFDKFNDAVQDGLAPTVFNSGGCSSYYLDEQGRNFSAWPWSTGQLRRLLSHFDIQNYDTQPVRAAIR